VAGSRVSVYKSVRSFALVSKTSISRKQATLADENKIEVNRSAKIQIRQIRLHSGDWCLWWMLLLRECLPRKSHKGIEAPYHKSLQMHAMHEMCGSLSTIGNADNTLALHAMLGFVLEI
jgi:hypothetical protein